MNVVDARYPGLNIEICRQCGRQLIRNGEMGMRYEHPADNRPSVEHEPQPRWVEVEEPW